VILFIEAISKILGYSLFFYGLWALLGAPFLQGELEKNFRRWKNRREIKRWEEVHQTAKKNYEVHPFVKHLELLLSSISKNSKNVNVFNFLFASMLIFVITVTVLYLLIHDLVFALGIGITFGILPYVAIRYRLTMLRLKTQYAFLIEYHVLFQNYQSTSKDIYYTMLNAVKETKNKELKHIYMKLLSSLQKDRGNLEFERAVNVFSYSINSTFAKRFAKLLKKAHIDRGDITMSLMDLNADIKKRKQDIQTDKTRKLETVILGYSPMILFPLMVFLAYRISGVVDFWYVFQQRTPLILFTISLVMSIFSVLTAFVMSKPRADI